MILAWLLACHPAPPDANPCAAPGTFGDAQNYTFAADFQITNQVAMAHGDLRLDASALTTDLRGLPVSPPDDLGQIAALLFDGLSQGELEQLMADDELQQSAIGFFGMAFLDGDPHADLSELGVLGNPVDLPSYFSEGAYTWLITTSTGTVPGKGLRMAQFIEASAASDNLDVRLTDTSAALQVDATLGDLEPIGLAAGTGTVDWSTMTVDGRGRALDPTRIDTVAVSFYADLDVDGLEAGFLRADADATHLWTTAPVGATADLTTLTGDVPFEGVTDDGLWALALQCSRCINPAPVAFSLLTTCPP